MSVFFFVFFRILAVSFLVAGFGLPTSNAQTQKEIANNTMSSRRVWQLLTVAAFAAAVAAVPGVTAAGAVDDRVMRGVQAEHEVTFRQALASGTFSCLNGIGPTLPISAVNDEYCDCDDGSDEPGSGACSYKLRYHATWRFQCAYTKVKKELFHSRINDGICDCCDGTDEYLGHITCKDTCAEVAEKEEREQRERAERRAAGLKAMAEMVEEGNRIRAEKEQELKAKREELVTVEAEVQNTEKARTEEEAKENEEREVIKRNSLAAKVVWEAEQEQKKAAAAAAKAAEPVEAAPEKPAEVVLGARFRCTQWRQTGECKGSGPRDASADKACDVVILAGWSGYCECNEVDSGTEVKYEKDCGHAELNCEYVCKHEGKDGIIRNGVDEPATAGDATAAAEPVEETFKLDDGSSHHRPEATTARQANTDAVHKKNSLNERIESLEKETSSTAFTPALLSLKDKCFERDEGSYVYKMCLYSSFTQNAKNGHGQTSLGSWEGFGEKTYSSWAGSAQDTSIMHFKNGGHCWNGPTRTVEVHVVCGPQNELVSITEPSMCTYKAVFHTPGVCE